MKISTRPRGFGMGRNYVKNKQTVPINLDIHALELMCNYVVSENRSVRRIQYINLRNLIELLDMDKYSNDDDKYKRILFIKRGLQARLEHNLQDKYMILKSINGGLLDNDIIDVSEFGELSNYEINWINETVAAAIRYAFIYQEQDYMLDLWRRFKDSDYSSIGEITAEIEEATARLNTAFRKSKVDADANESFNLTQGILEAAMTDAWNQVTSVSRKLVTGMQGFNQFIGGGFENTRVYLLLGLTGSGKSMALINLVYQMKKYNKRYKPTDPTKRPCIVYLTMENTVTETIQRLFQICTGEDLAAQCDPQTAIQKLRVEGELYLTDESPIDIIVRFKPNKSVDTSYLYTMVEDLEDEGYETICVVQDHAKRIRSTDRNQDVRLELGDVINEMKTFAMLKDIPVITNSHLNRDAARIIDESSSKSKADLTRLLGKSNIGESMLMLDNVDFACVANPEYDNEKRKWMVFKQIKTRIKTDRTYICEPFDVNNQIKLIEDFYSPIPVFKDSLYEAPIMVNDMSGVKVPAQHTNVYTKPQNSRYTANIEVIDDDDEDNIYELGTTYSSNNTTTHVKIQPVLLAS